MLRLIFIFLAGLVLCAQTPIPGFPPGMFQNRAAIDAFSASFSGVGDVKSSATYYWGLRGYNAAYATGSNPSAVVCNQTTFTTCSTINILADGTFDVATASGSLACSTTCVVKTLTDQVAGLSFTAASAAASGTLVFNCSGTRPCIRCAGACNYAASPGSAIPQTWAMVLVAKRTGNFSAQQSILSNASACGFGPSPNTMACYAVTTQTAVATDSTFHAAVFTAAGASSDLNIDGAPTTINPGTSQLASGLQSYQLGTDGFALAFTGDILELAVYSNSAAAQASALSTNIHSYWGF